MKTELIINKKPDGAVELRVYGYLGAEGITAAAFLDGLRQAEQQASNIDVRINCGGGVVYEGLAIYNAMRQSKARIETYIDGVAASMGTIIALGGKRVHMSKAARIMTHRAASSTQGTADQMRRDAQELEHLEEIICSIYATKTGVSAAQARAKYLAVADRWMSADEALAEGFVDAVFNAPTASIPTSISGEREMVQAYCAVLPPAQQAVPPTPTSAPPATTPPPAPPNADLTDDPQYNASFDELHSNGGMAKLEARNPALFALKFFQKFGKLPKDCKLDAATQERVTTFAKRAELDKLKATDFKDLFRTDQLGRLRELDPVEYARKEAAMRAN